MKGEEKVWFQIAKRIGGHTVEELKCKMLHTEFIRWKQELEDEYNERSPTEWQIAVVAYENALLRHVLSHLFAKTVPKPKFGIKDFLIQFEKKADPKNEAKAIKEMEAKALVRSTNAATTLRSIITGSKAATGSKKRLTRTGRK